MRRFLFVSALLGSALSVRGLAAQIIEERRPFKVAVTDGRKTIVPKTRLKDSDRVCSLQGERQLAERTLLDVLNGGQLQTSAELVRLCIGEGKVKFPIYFLVGSNSASVSDPTADEQSLATLVAPTGGTFNVQLANANEIGSWGELTDLSFSYQAGLRYSRLPVTGGSEESEPVASGDFAIGLRFQTGAWDLAHPETAGVFWLQAQVGGRATANRKLQRVFGPDATDPTTLSVEAGIVIEGRINLKGSWSKVLNNDQTPGLKNDVLKLGFDYRIHKPTAPPPSP